MKRLMFVMAILLCLLIPVSAAIERVTDEADILTAEEQTELSDRLEEVSEECDIELAVVITQSHQYYYDSEVAEDWEDYIILRVSVDDRQWEIDAGGKGDTCLTEDRMETLSDAFEPLLAEGDYTAAIETFADTCGELMAEAEQLQWVGVIGGSLVFGLIVALIATLIMRGQLKSVKYQRGATGYAVAGSLRLTREKDIFLYSHVTRVKKPEPQNNSYRGGRRGRF